MDELLNQTKSFFVNQTLEPKEFTKGIAFNVIPHIDVFLDDGSTKEEWKMVVETKKILDPKIKVHATCVRVPTFIGHAEAVNLELEQPLDEHEARASAGRSARRAGGRPARAGRLCHAAGSHRPGRRVREPRARRSHVENGLAMWVVSDNLRKGAALNAIQIAEELIKGYI